MSSYKHGAYASLLPTTDLAPLAAASTLPIYIGVLPVHQLMDYSASVNKPILIQGFAEVAAKTGYNDTNWVGFDLCEALYAHFKTENPVGPIVLINVLDPTVHKTAEKSLSVVLNNGIGEIRNELIILNTVTITGKVFGTDFKAEYSPDGSAVMVTAITEIASPVTVKFKEVDLAQVTKTTVIGTTTAEGIKSGIDVVDLVYQSLNRVPNILDSPGWSHIQEVRVALVAKSQGINGHWCAFVNTNLKANTEVNTLTKAIEWKTANGYIGTVETPSWPLALKDGKVFHLSTLRTVTMMLQDIASGGLPSETPSNKGIQISGLCLMDKTPILFDQIQANDLNAKGICTAIYFGGRWVLWGPHTGAYEYGKEMDPRDKFDAGKRMLMYVLNDFQLRYGNKVDATITRSKVDTILNDYQERLDGFVSQGALVHAKINFSELSNPISDMIEGDFVFGIEPTTAPIGKSLTAQVRYTTAGLKTFFGGEKA
jgi:phage tail sheath protein FI